MISKLPRSLIKFFCHLSLFLLLLSAKTSAEESQESLPFCGLTESSNKYIFVSTLDGRVTALNPDDGGSVVWSIHPGSEAMLSSSIHKLELTNYGHLVRMIPSLSGGLYKFNGENIEAIPVTADNLLQASFRYSDDLVISGGKERQTFGVSLHSGQILYECSMKGCGNESHASSGDVLVIQRLGQIVRAVEPRTGAERWNFSVAQHDLKLISDCHGLNQESVNYQLKVIVPEGLICALDIENPNKIIWKHKFNSPVVSAWKVFKGKLFDIDLFSGVQPGPMDVVVSPSLYVGMHDKQLYIQESVLMIRKRQELASKFGQHLIANENNFPRIPWKPVPASSGNLGLIEGKAEEDALDEVSQRQTTALSVLYASPYVEGSGFYLFTEEALDKSQKGACNVTISTKENDENVFDNASDSSFSEETPVQIVIVSLWYWWREVLVISLTTAVLFNVMFARRFLIWKSREITNVVEANKTYLPHTGSDSGIEVHLEKTRNDSESHLAQDFNSRYLADFDPVNCLGKGGFGVVFEAKNKIDDCHYAIKRIVLPNRQESRDRVMREVKALAKLDHYHIVRYFNAWTECPPAGWQEQQDNVWINTHCSTDDMFTTTGATSNQNSYIPLKNSSKSSVFVNLNSVESDSSDKDSFIRKKNTVSDVSDSFIVFESPESQRDQSESVIPISSDGEESATNSRVHSRVQRPTSLQTDQKYTSPLYLNPARVYLYIQMQLCQRQSLKEWLTINSDRDYNYILKIFEQILQAVEYVHLHSLIHRDLKPSNIFFSLDDQIKVGDFGLVTAMTEGDCRLSPCESVKVGFENERHTAQVGTQLYMSPEQLNGESYSYKVDIYSLGLILFELLVPFSTQMERIQLLQDIKENKFTKSFQEKYKSEYELLKLMLSRCPEERPTTYGIRARPPFGQSSIDEQWHFELPQRRRVSSKTSRTSTSSNEGTADSR